MSSLIDESGEALAHRVRKEREARGWSLAELAGRSGLSKAMLSNVERAAASPTAGTLVRIGQRLTGALIGAGLLADPHAVNAAALGSRFLLPLLASPVLAVFITILVYGFLHASRKAAGIN